MLIDLQCAWTTLLFYYVTCYCRNYLWSFTSQLKTHVGLISWFRTLNLKWIEVLGKFRSRFHSPTTTPLHLLSYILITRNHRCIVHGMSLISSREQREFPARLCWNMIIDVYYLASTFPTENSPWLLFTYCSLRMGKTKMGSQLKCSNSTLCWLSLSWRLDL